MSDLILEASISKEREQYVTMKTSVPDSQCGSGPTPLKTNKGPSVGQADARAQDARVERPDRAVWPQ